MQKLFIFDKMQKFSQKSASCKVHLNRRARCVWRCIYRKFSLIGRFVSVWGVGWARKITKVFAIGAFEKIPKPSKSYIYSPIFQKRHRNLENRNVQSRRVGNYQVIWCSQKSDGAKGRTAQVHEICMEVYIPEKNVRPRRPGKNNFVPCSPAAPWRQNLIYKHYEHYSNIMNIIRLCIRATQTSMMNDCHCLGASE